MYTRRWDNKCEPGVFFGDGCWLTSTVLCLLPGPLNSLCIISISGSQSLRWAFLYVLDCAEDLMLSLNFGISSIDLTEGSAICKVCSHFAGTSFGFSSFIPNFIKCCGAPHPPFVALPAVRRIARSGTCFVHASPLELTCSRFAGSRQCRIDWLSAERQKSKGFPFALEISV